MRITKKALLVSSGIILAFALLGLWAFRPGSGSPSLEESLSQPSSTTVPESSEEAPRTEESLSSSSSEEPSDEPSESSSQPEAVTVPKALPLDGLAFVGYYASWGREQGFSPLSLRSEMITHLNYAFADIGPDHRITLPYPDMDLANFADLRALKRQNPGLKTLISIGGWDYSKNFSNMAATAQGREAFAESCVEFILRHGFDGVDLDWEYPVSGGIPGNSNRPQDKGNFTLLLQVMRQKLDEQAAKDGRPYLLTLAGAPTSSYLSKIEPAAVASYVDYIFLMGYDMHGPWDEFADFTAPLRAPDSPSPHHVPTVEGAVNAYLSQGISPRKLVLGMPFYGYRYSLEEGDGLYSPISTASSIGYDEVLGDYLGDPNFVFSYHPQARVPSLFDGSTFISYEDEDSIREKTRLARAYGLGGVGAWELSHDKDAILLSSAWNALRS